VYACKKKYIYVSQMHVRAHPFKSAPYHGKVRTDCCVFITPWMSIVLEDLDLTDPEHWKYLSWGRLIMPFECAMSPSETHLGMGPTKSYAFIEEYWPYENASNDVLCRYACPRT